MILRILCLALCFTCSVWGQYLSETEINQLTTPRKSDRLNFELFYEEYSIKETYKFPRLQIALGKYQLDKAVWVGDKLVNNLEDFFEIEYDFGHGKKEKRVYFGVWRDIAENSKFKTNLSLEIIKLDARIELRLTIPIGN